MFFDSLFAMTREEIEWQLKRRLGRDYVMEQRDEATLYYGGDAGVFVVTFILQDGSPLEERNSIDAVDGLEIFLYDNWSAELSPESREDLSFLFNQKFDITCSPDVHQLRFDYYLSSLVTAGMKGAQANIQWALDEFVLCKDRAKQLLNNI